MLDINSGEEYAKKVVQVLQESEKDLPAALLNLWCEEVYSAAINSYADYLVGKREHFLLTRGELEKCFEVAGLSYATTLLDDVIDQDLIQASINETGNLVYHSAKNR